MSVDSQDNKSILEVSVGQKGKIITVAGVAESSAGCCQQVVSSETEPRSIRRLRSMGIEEGQEVKIVAKQPFGPVIVETGNVQTAIGRGMASKIYMEVSKK